MQEVFIVFAIACALWVCYFLGNLFKNQAESKKVSTMTTVQQTTYQLLMVVVTNAVIATNEEFVKLYKGTEEWAEEKKNEAFHKTMNRIIEMLGKDMLTVLNETFGDTDELLTSLILRTVNDENASQNSFSYRM